MRKGFSLGNAASALVVGAIAVVLLLPIIAIFVRMPPAEIVARLRTPVAFDALVLSVRTTAVAVAAIVLAGTPLAYALSRSRSRAARALEALLQLPVVVPPAVAGVGLLLVFGRGGWLGPALAALHVGIAFSTPAVVIAQIFIATPFYVFSAKQAFDGVDPDLIAVSRTLGVNRTMTFWRVTVPIALSGLIGGAALAWARALGEFGATMLFAGSMTGVTQTLPLAIYAAFDSSIDVAVAMSALLLASAFALLALIRFLDWRPKRASRRNAFRTPAQAAA